MATNLYRVKTATGSTVSGRELLDTMEQLGDSFSRLERIFAAMTQQKDSATDTAADYVTMAAVFQFTDAADTVDSAVALAAYAELNSLIGNIQAALKQACARLKQ